MKTQKTKQVMWKSQMAMPQTMRIQILQLKIQKRMKKLLTQKKNPKLRMLWDQQMVQKLSVQKVKQTLFPVILYMVQQIFHMPISFMAK